MKFSRPLDSSPEVFTSLSLSISFSSNEPAQFRSHLSSLGFNSIICFPSFNQQCLEAWPQDRIEKISDAIDNLNPFEEKKDYFATSILSESVNLIFDTEGRISLTKKLVQHSKIKTRILFVGLGKTFQIWEPTLFEKFKTKAIRESNLNRSSLKWEKKIN